MAKVIPLVVFVGAALAVWLVWTPSLPYCLGLSPKIPPSVFETWRRDRIGGVEFYTPRDMAWQEIQGVDSEIVVFRRPGLKLSFAYGPHDRAGTVDQTTGPEDEMQAWCAGNVRATVTTWHSPHGDVAAGQRRHPLGATLHLRAPDASGGVSVTAEAASGEDLTTALSVFKTFRSIESAG